MAAQAALPGSERKRSSLSDVCPESLARCVPLIITLITLTTLNNLINLNNLK